VKITKLQPWLVKASDTYWGEFLFLEVSTDAGITGWGEITTTTPSANRALAGLIRQVGDLVTGDDASRIEETWHKVFRAFTYVGSRGAVTEVLSALDIALWDIRGRALGVPVYELLGGPVRETISLYTHPDQSKFTSPAGVAEEIGRIVESGHTALKFDPFPHTRGESGYNDHYLDGQLSKADERTAITLTERVREAAGPDTEILIDAHARFNVPTAVRLCRSLYDAAGIDWFEEPVPPESYHALKQVRDQVAAAISVGERLHTRWEFIPVLENRLADYVMPDVTWTGGISELKKIATLAEAYYVPISPHDASGPVNLVAGSHVMMTVPNFYRVESSRFDLRSYNQFLQAPLDNSGGELRLSGEPGLGIDFDLDYMRASIIDGIGG
jgi:galactonate dehydratase